MGRAPRETTTTPANCECKMQASATQDPLNAARLTLLTAEDNSINLHSGLGDKKYSPSVCHVGTNGVEHTVVALSTSSNRDDNRKEESIFVLGKDHCNNSSSY